MFHTPAPVCMWTGSDNQCCYLSSNQFGKWFHVNGTVNSQWRRGDLEHCACSAGFSLSAPYASHLFRPHLVCATVQSLVSQKATGAETPLQIWIIPSTIWTQSALAAAAALEQRLHPLSALLFSLSFETVERSNRGQLIYISGFPWWRILIRHLSESNLSSSSPSKSEYHHLLIVISLCGLQRFTVKSVNAAS